MAAESGAQSLNGGLIAPLRVVADELAAVDRELIESIPEDLGLVSKASRAVLRAGGKRLRPALVLLTARAFGGINKRAIRVAGALEMVHGASLMHDDVVDNTQTRRGQATIGAWWSNKVAVMLGDYLYTRSLLEMCGDENRYLVTIVSEATGRMVLGQIREIEEQNNFDITVDDYLFIIREKTAVLMSAASRMGAIVSGASKDAIEAMAEYGMQLGMAFQIVDDVLDFWGEEEQLGKPVGSDLGERKFTLPFIYTLAKASPEQRASVRLLVDEAKGRLSRRAVRRAMAVMDGVDARRYAMEVAAEYAARAREALRLAAPPRGAEELAMLVDYVLERHV
jgi:octaprenyl-diphosphate synthase